MLLLLIIVHIFSPNGAASPGPRPLEPRDDDTCNDINNCRTLLSVIWGCLATIFACTWVSVHPNVPAPNQSALTLFLRRLKLMLIALIAPEIVVGFAARQFLAAQKLSKEFGLSKTHAFFFTMGGFVDSRGCVLYSKKDLEEPELLRDISNIKIADILDKSKGDALSKGVALAQGLWFTTQCLARVHQHLVVTRLEIATMAFVLMNVFIWILWWNKPLEVQQQITLSSARQRDAGALAPGHQSQLALPVTLDLRISTGGSRIGDFLFTILGNVDVVVADSASTELTNLIVDTTESTNLDSEQFDYDSTRTQLTQIEIRYCRVGAASVPDFWSLPRDPPFDTSAGLFPVLTGCMFGAVHCAAWNTNFATPGEMWIWRVCSAIIGATPPVWFLYLLSYGRIRSRIETRIYTILPAFWPIWTFFLLSLYVLARLFLIALPLAELRSLPPSAYMDVNWATYIPHI
ncbi:hypothetical protein FB45DRAFT_839551 [Roridomyces roridus]|uniref:Uncharacterized protein n=1 Tax=Roridomyces roridus TaxID=1738132 RepID=A0AAD7BGM3_9AGAR|nr:hypothetical protein FB45DRAFT_839551 [Roridomyces roridus]